MSEPARTAMSRVRGSAASGTRRVFAGASSRPGGGWSSPGWPRPAWGCCCSCCSGCSWSPGFAVVAQWLAARPCSEPPWRPLWCCGGLVLTWILAVPALLGLRHLARLTRRLSGHGPGPDGRALPATARPRPAAVPRAAVLADDRPGDPARPGLERGQRGLRLADRRAARHRDPRRVPADRARPGRRFGSSVSVGGVCAKPGPGRAVHARRAPTSTACRDAAADRRRPGHGQPGRGRGPLVAARLRRAGPHPARPHRPGRAGPAGLSPGPDPDRLPGIGVSGSLCDRLHPRETEATGEWGSGQVQEAQE